MGPDGSTLGPGRAGELLLRSPQLMLGYLGAPDKTAEAIQQGWLRTGDHAWSDDQGHLFVQDRVGDLLRHRGEKVVERSKIVFCFYVSLSILAIQCVLLVPTVGQ